MLYNIYTIFIVIIIYKIKNNIFKLSVKYKLNNYLFVEKIKKNCLKINLIKVYKLKN